MIRFSKKKFQELYLLTMRDSVNLVDYDSDRIMLLQIMYGQSGLDSISMYVYG